MSGSIEPNQNEQGVQKASAPNAPDLNPILIVWLILSFLFMIIMCNVSESPQIIRAGFIMKTFIVIVGTITALLGALIGDAIRRFVRPDIYFTSGGFFQLMGLKLFWLMGPQLIGMFIGGAVGATLILQIFG